MSSLFALIGRRARSLRALDQGQMRHYSSATSEAAQPDDGTLPLRGIRVLDMTRVLAGVSPIPIKYCSIDVRLTEIIELAILYTDSWRPRVSSGRRRTMLLHAPSNP